MRRPANSYRVVAYMYNDDDRRTYEVVEDKSGRLWVRDTRVGQPWSQVAAPSPMIPDLDTYLTRCADNFGWRTETVTA